MNALKIGIVEDDLIIAQSVSEMLLESGYAVTRPAKRYSEAIAMIETEQPDLLLLDIQIVGRLDGIEVARTVRRSFDLPVIFLTANTDFTTIERAKELAPSAFLAKPITRAQLFAAIEIAIANWSGRPPVEAPAETQPAPGLFVKDGTSFRRISYSDLLVAESRDNYVRLQLVSGEHLMTRMTLAELLKTLDPARFMQVHRSYVVAVAHIEKVLPDDVIAGGVTVPVSKTHRPALMKVLGIR